MNINYIQYPESQRFPFKSLYTALNERKDNIDLTRISDKQKVLLQEFLDNPTKMFDYEEVTMLNELAAMNKYLWDKERILKVYFFSSNESLKNEVISHANEWSNHCAIRFELSENANESNIRVSFDDRDGRWSNLGIVAKDIAPNKATMNLSGLRNSSFEERREFKQVVLHEFGHALGLLHEHQSPAFNMDWDEEEVYDFCMNHYGWDRSKTYQNILRSFNPSEVKFSQADSLSIMAYWIPPEFTLSRRTFPLNYELSERDKVFIGELYPKAELLKS